MDKLTLNPKEVAQLLGVAQSTVYNLIHARQIPFIAVRPNRYVIPRAALDNWIKESQQ